MSTSGFIFVSVEAYERRIEDLENKKLVLDEKIAKCGRVLPDFDKTYRTALDFLSNPHKFWASEHIADKRCAAKLVFEGNIPYCKNEGYRTPPIAQPFRLL